MTSVIRRDRRVTDAGDVAARMARIADEVAAPAADEVDQHGPVPGRDHRRPEGRGPPLGPGPAVDSAAWAPRYPRCRDGLVALGRQCASSAMVVAMHHIQVACLVRHGRNDLLRDYLVELVDHQYLLASATTEVGTGGDVRSSVCAVDVADGTFRLEKQAPVISLRPTFADAVLATARRSADSPENDQVLVLCRPARARAGAGGGVERPRVPGHLQPRVHPPGQRRRRRRPRRSLRRHLHPDHAARWPTCCGARCGWASPPPPSTGPAGSCRPRPASAGHDAGRRPPPGRHHRAPPAVHRPGPRRRSTRYRARSRTIPSGCRRSGFAVAMNSLKVSASTLVVDIVRQCMVICGLASYRTGHALQPGSAPARLDGRLASW